MMKRFLSAVLSLTMILSLFTGLTFTASAEESVFVKITSTNSLTDGTYLIVYEDGGLALNGGLTDKLDKVSNTVTVTITDDEIEATDAMLGAAFTYDSANKTLKGAGGLYMGQTSDSNGMLSSATTSYVNTITFDGSGNANIVSGGAYLRYNAATDQTRFRYFKSSTYTGQKAVALYKLTGGSETVHNVTFVSNEDGTHNIVCSVQGCTEHPAVNVPCTYEDVVTPPTPATQGYTTHTCLYCEYSYNDTYVDPVVHTYELVATVDTTKPFVLYNSKVNSVLGTGTVTVSGTEYLNTASYYEADIENNQITVIDEQLLTMETVDGGFRIACGEDEGGTLYLTYGDNINTLSKAHLDQAAETDHTVWTIENSNYIRAVNGEYEYNGNTNHLYLEGWTASGAKYFTVYGSTNTPSATQYNMSFYQEPSENPNNDTVTVYVADQTDSAAFYAYVYNKTSDTNDGEGWPGHPLTSLGTDKNGDNY